MIKADGASDCPCSKRTTSLSSGVYSKEEAFEGYLQRVLLEPLEEHRAQVPSRPPYVCG